VKHLKYCIVVACVIADLSGDYGGSRCSIKWVFDSYGE